MTSFEPNPVVEGDILLAYLKMDSPNIVNILNGDTITQVWVVEKYLN